MPESRCQLALPVDRGFDPFGSASEQMCSVTSTRRHLHIFWDIQRSQHKGKNIFISPEVLMLERRIQVVIQGLSGLPTDAPFGTYQQPVFAASRKFLIYLVSDYLKLYGVSSLL